MSSSPAAKPVSESGFVCACEEFARSACITEQFYSEHEGKPYCVLHFPSRQKSGAFKHALQRKLETKDFDFRGVWFPEVTSFEGFEFSAPADFRYATFTAGANFRDARFSAANFDFVYFNSIANFSFVTFDKDAQFTSAHFCADAYFINASFRAPVNFSSARFRAAVRFGHATLQAANFNNAHFTGELADFSGATFSGAADFGDADFDAIGDFSCACFDAEAYFINATFSAPMDFSFATFKHHVRFAGKESNAVFGRSASLDLRFVRVEKPEHVSFHTVNLRPSWFVNVDPRKFEFNNAKWYWSNINKEITRLENRQISSPYRMLAIACRHLASNCEDNHRYEEASRFRYLAMDSRRLKWVEKLQGKFFREHWKALRKTSIRLVRSLRPQPRAPRRKLLRVRRYASVYWKDFDLLHWLYWALSGYGERVLRAFVVLAAIFLLCALMYTQTRFTPRETTPLPAGGGLPASKTDKTSTLPLADAVVYSAAVMTLQKPDRHPATTSGQTIVFLETILGPVQTALLGLAIRRKFMR